MEALNIFELDILFKIREIFQNSFFDFIMPIISLFGDAGIFWIAVSLILMISKNYRKTGFQMGLALLIGVILVNAVLKNAVARIRPYDMIGGIEPLAKNITSDYSFPSGHTLASFEASIPIMIRDKRLGIPAIILSILIAFSRLYLGMHFPTDVIFGMILGCIFATASIFIIDLCYKKYYAIKAAKKGSENESKNS